MFKVKEGILIGGKTITGSGVSEVLTAADVGSMAYQNSDTFNVSALTATTIKLDDTDSGFNLSLQSTSTNTADRQLTIDVDDASRILRMTGNAVISGTNTGDQTISFGTTGLTPSTDTGGNVTVSGTLKPSNGGTGFNTVTTVGELYYGNTTTTMGRIASVASGSYLASAGAGVAPVWTAFPAINNGTLSFVIGSAGATNTTVTVGTGTGYSANTGSNVSYDIRIGPAITNLVSTMTSAGSGFVKKSASDSYTIDTTTYYTSSSSMALGTPSSGNLSNCTFPTLNQNTTGNANTATVGYTLYTEDSRAAADTPQSFGMGVVSDFKQNTTDSLADGGTYHGVLTFRQYTDWSGGGVRQLGFTDNHNIWIRGANADTSWSTWNKIWHQGNDGAGSGLDADLLDGQQGTYYLDWTNVTNKPDPVVTVTLTGDISGSSSATLTDLASGTVSITTTIQPNSVALGTDTTGNYVATVSGGTGVTVSGTAGEGWTATVSIGQDVSAAANPTFAGATLDAVRVGITATNEIDTVSGNLIIDSAGGTVTIDDNLTVSGNLIVNGSTVTVNSTTTTLDDPIITLGGDTAPVSDDNKDRGVEYRWHNGSAAKLGFFGLDDSTGKFTFIPDATNTSEVFSGTKGTIDANLEWADVLNKPDPVVTVSLSGDVSGSAATTLTDLASGTVSITTTIQPNSVALGTDTTGNYAASVSTSGIGLSITGVAGEGTVYTVNSNAAEASTPSTLAHRDSAGDLNVRLLRSEYADQSNISGGMLFRINNTTDNYLRVCSDKAAIRTFLDVPTSGHSHNYLASNTGTTFSGGILSVNMNAGALGSVLSSGPFQLYQPNISTDAFMSFHVAGDFAVNFGLDGTTNDLFVGGWSMGAVKYKLWHQGNDGSGSGLDADLLDGQSSAYFLDWANVTNKPDPVITLTGNASGSCTLTDLGSATLNATVSYSASAGSAGAVTVTDSDANSTYRLTWHSGNSIYSTAEIYCNPYSGVVYSNTFQTHNAGGFGVGDEAYLDDCGASNTARIRGSTDLSKGYLVFGNANNTALGRAGTGRLTYGGQNVVISDGDTYSIHIIGNADSVDGQHFTWANSDNNLYWVWGATNNGDSRLIQRSLMSVGYATSAGSITGQANSATITASTTATASSIVQRTGAGGISVVDVSSSGFVYTSGVYSTGVLSGTRLIDCKGPGSNNTANLALGTQTLNSNTTGSNNIAVGLSALYYNTEGTYNVAIGTQALSNNKLGSMNVAIGDNALYDNGVNNNGLCNYNVAIGRDTLKRNINGEQNIAIGYDALSQGQTDMNKCVGIGHQALRDNLGIHNIAIGALAMRYNTSGNYNIAIGTRSMGINVSASWNNVSVGNDSMANVTSGSHNTCVGASAGASITTGAGNIIIGSYAADGNYRPLANLDTHNNHALFGSTHLTFAGIQVGWSVYSDARDKTEFADIPHGLSFVNALKPISYKFKLNRNSEETNGPKRYGFKAQDILELEGDDNVIVVKVEPEKLMLNSDYLVPILVNAIKELTDKVNSLEEKLNGKN